MRSALRRCPDLRSLRDDRRAPRLAHRRAPRCAAHRQHSPRGNGSPHIRAGFRQSVARAQGRRLAARRALRFCRAARRDCGAHDGFRARSSTSIAIRAAPRSIPVRRRRNSSRPRPSTASRSIAQAWRQTQPKSQSGDVFTSILTMRRSAERSRACARSISASRCSTPIPFARSSRACSTANCPCSISGTNSGASCDPGLRETIGAVLAASGQTSVVDGRFKGGWITRAYGRPGEGVEAVQLELACRAYMQEPERPAPENWPTPIDEKRAAPTRATIKRVLEAILEASAAMMITMFSSPTALRAIGRRKTPVLPDGLWRSNSGIVRGLRFWIASSPRPAMTMSPSERTAAHDRASPHRQYARHPQRPTEPSSAPRAG